MDPILRQWLQTVSNNRKWNISDVEKVRLGTAAYLKEDADSEFNKKIKTGIETWKTRYGRDLSEKEILDLVDTFKNKGQFAASQYLKDLGNAERQKSQEAQRLIDDALKSEKAPPSPKPTEAAAPKPAEAPKPATEGPKSTSPSPDDLRKLYSEVGDVIKRAKSTGLQVNKLTGKELSALVSAYQSRGAEGAAQTLADINQSRTGKSTPREPGRPAPKTTKPATTTREPSPQAPPGSVKPSVRTGKGEQPPTARESGSSVLFGVAGAGHIPSDIEKLQTGFETATDGVYAPGWVGPEGTRTQRMRRGAEELGADVTRLAGDIEMGIIGTAGAADLTGKAAKAARTVKLTKPATEWTKPAADWLGKIPGASAIAKWANRLVGPTMALQSGFQAAKKTEQGEYAPAARDVFDASHWLTMGTKYGTRGLGQQFIRGGVQNFLDQSAAGISPLERIGRVVGGDASATERVGTVADMAGIALGAGMKHVAPALVMKKAYDEGKKEVAKLTAERLAKTGLRVAEKEALQMAGKAAIRGGLKAAAKQIPLAGLAVAAPFAISRAMEGDWSGAALELGSAVPIAGLAADVYLAKRDFDAEMEKSQEAESKQQNAVNALRGSPGAVSDKDEDENTTDIEQDKYYTNPDTSEIDYGAASDEEIVSPDFLRDKSEQALKEALELRVRRLRG